MTATPAPLSHVVQQLGPLGFLRWTKRLGCARVLTTLRARRLPLDRALAASLRQQPPSQEPGALEAVEAITEFWLRQVRLTRTSCMPRALARFELLRRSGVPAQIVFGVRSGEDSELLGHAWLELRGLPIMERETLDYRETFRYG